LCNQTNGYSEFIDSPLRFARKNPFTTGEEWSEGEEILLSIKCRLGGKYFRVLDLNGVDDLKDPTFCLDLWVDI